MAQTDVFHTEHKPIREGYDIVGEARDVVPDKDSIGDSRPVHDVDLELRVARVAQRRCVVALLPKPGALCLHFSYMCPEPVLVK